MRATQRRRIATTLGALILGLGGLAAFGDETSSSFVSRPSGYGQGGARRSAATFTDAGSLEEAGAQRHESSSFASRAGFLGGLPLPARVSDLAAVARTSHSVTLAWTAPYADAENSTGTASAYQVRWSTTGRIANEADFATATVVASAPAPQPPAYLETLTVAGLTAGVTHYFAVAAVNEHGVSGDASADASTRTLVGEGCVHGATVKLSGGANFTGIQAAVDSLPKDLDGPACVVVLDGATYAQQVTVRNFTNDGSSITIYADPASGLRPVISPPANSTAAFLIAQASVNIQGFDIVPTDPVNWGVKASSGQITLSSVNVHGVNGNIKFAAVELSSWNAVAYASVTVTAAHGFYLPGSLGSVISRSSAQVDAAGAARYPLYLRGATTTTVETFFSSSTGSGIVLDSGANYNAVSLSSVSATRSALFTAIQLTASSSNTFTGVFVSVANMNATALAFNSSSNGNLVTGSTFTYRTSAGGGPANVSFGASSSNTMTTSMMFGGNGTAVEFTGGVWNRVETSTLATSNGTYPAVWFTASASSNTIWRSYINGGYGVDFRGSSSYNTLSHSTVNAYGSSRALLFREGALYGRVEHTYARSTSGNGAEFTDSTIGNVIAFSTIVTSGLRGVYSSLASSNSIVNSYVQGSTGAYITNSTGTTIAASTIVATAANSDALAALGGLVRLSITSSTLISPGTGRGVSFIGASDGDFILSSVTFAGAQRGVQMATQAANFVLSVDSVNFRGLASGATAIHFLGGTFVATITAAGFEGTTIGANVSAAALDAASRLTMKSSKGARKGSRYENDSQSLVDWAGEAPAWCVHAATVKQDGSAEHATITAALASLPTTLTGPACVVVQDGASYSEEVVVQNFTNNGSSITIMADPASGLRPVVSNPSLNAAFTVKNASVSIVGFEITGAGGSYAVDASSPYVKLSSLSITQGAMGAAVILRDDWATVEYTSVTAGNARGLDLRGDWATVRWSTAVNAGTTGAAFHLTGADSATVTGLYARNTAAYYSAALDGGSHHNAVTGSTFVASGLSGYAALSLDGADDNSFHAIVSTGPEAAALRLQGGADRNSFTASSFTATSASGGVAFWISASSGNHASGNWITNTNGYGVALDNGAWNNAIERSTITSTHSGSYAFALLNASSNSVDGVYVENPVGTAGVLTDGSILNTVSRSTFVTNAAGQSSFFLYSADSNTVTDSLFLSTGSYAFLLNVGANHNTVRRSTAVTHGAGVVAFYAIGSSSNAFEDIYAQNLSGYAAAFQAGASYNSVARSTFIVSGGGYYSFAVDASTANLFADAYIENRAGTALAIYNGAHRNEFRRSTAAATGGAGAGFYAQSVSSLTLVSFSARSAGTGYAAHFLGVSTAGVSDSFFDAAAASHALYADGVSGLEIRASTLTATTSATAAFEATASSAITLTHSHARARRGVWIKQSTNTVVAHSIIEGVGSAYSGVLFTDRNVGILVASNTIRGGDEARGVYIDAFGGGANMGLIHVVTNTISGVAAGVEIGNAAAGARVFVASNTIHPVQNTSVDAAGVYLYALPGGATVQNNSIFYRTPGSMGGFVSHGVVAQDSPGLLLSHNRINNPGMVTGGSFAGVRLINSPSASILNNDVHSTGTALTNAYLVRVLNASTGARFHNNVVSSSFVVTGTSGTIEVDAASVSGFLSDYNLAHSSNDFKSGLWGGTSLSMLDGSWMFVTGNDKNSVGYPYPGWRSVTAGSEDFHLQSRTGRWTPTGWETDNRDSEGLDAARPVDAVGLETAPNGGRMNLGSYGGTDQASRSQATGCATLRRVNKSYGPYTEISFALSALWYELSGPTCVQVQDAATYNEQVTVQNFTNAGSSITIFTDPAVGSYAVVDAPAGSTAAFHILNASVTVAGMSAVIDEQIPYGVWASSSYVALSSVSVSTSGGLGVYAAGVRVSSWSLVEYSTIAVWNAHAVDLSYSTRTVLAYSTATTKNSSYYAVHMTAASSHTIMGSYAENAAGTGVILLNGSSRNLINATTMVGNRLGSYGLYAQSAASNTISGSFVRNAAGVAARLNTGADDNAIARSTFTTSLAGSIALQIFDADRNTVDASYIQSLNGYGLTLQSGADSNTVSRSTAVSSDPARYGLYIVAASGNSIIDSLVRTYAGHAVYVAGGSTFTMISRSSMIADTHIGLIINDSDTATVTGSYIRSEGSIGVNLTGGAQFNRIEASTVSSGGSTYAVFMNASASSNTVADSMLDCPAGTAFGVGQSTGNQVHRSTLTSDGIAVYLVFASSTVLLDSYVSGSTAVYTLYSTATVIGGSTLVATAATGSGVTMAGGVGLALTTNTFLSPGGGRGVYLGGVANMGTLAVSSVVFRGASSAILISTQGANFELAIDSVNFRGLASGATAIHFLGGTFVATITAAGFEDSSIGANVSAAALDAASRLTMKSATGPRRGTRYENDPQGLADWEGEAPAWCAHAATVKQAGGADFTSLSAAVASLPATLTGPACVVVQDAATYAEQVTVQNFTNAGSSITIFTDPAVGSYAVVDPPAGSTAAFHILNASVSVAMIAIRPTVESVSYGVFASSPIVAISSLSVDSGGRIAVAGLSVSSWGAVSHSSVTVQNARALVYRQSVGTTVSYSSFQAAGSAAAVYFDEASSNTFTVSLASNSAGKALELGLAFYNTVSLSSVNAAADGDCVLCFDQSGWNAVDRVYARNANGYGIALWSDSNWNTVTDSTASVQAISYAALLVGGSSNTLTRVRAENIGWALSVDGGWNQITDAVARADHSGSAALYMGGDGNAILRLSADNPSGTGAWLDSGAAHNSLSQSTMTGTNSSYYALRLAGASSNTLTGLFATNTGGNAIGFETGSAYNTLTLSTMVSNGVNRVGLLLDASPDNTLDRIYSYSTAGAGAYLANTSHRLTITGSTFTSAAASYRALLLDNINDSAITASVIRNDAGSALEIYGARDSVSLSTVVAAGVGLRLVAATTVTVTHSYIQGSTAALVSQSTGTRVESSALAATAGAGDALFLTGGSVNLTLASSTFSGGASGRGLALDTGNAGVVSLGSVTFSAAARAVAVSTQASNFELAVDSVQFRALTAGATALHFYGGTFVATITAAGFEDSNIGANVSAAALDGASRLTMRGHAGARRGPDYENDPQGLVDWAGYEPYPGCAVTNNVGAGQPYATIQAAVNALPATLAGRSCVVIRDAATYAEQVTVQNFTNAGSSITIFTDPSVGSYAVVDPPAGSTAAFHILNASVSVSGVRIVPTGQTVPYGVRASSAYVALSSVSVDSGGLIWVAGVSLSSWSAVSYSSVTVQSAYGFWLAGSTMSVISYSSAASADASRSSYYLNGASSITLLASYGFTTLGEALRLDASARHNLVTGSTFTSNASNRHTVYLAAASSNAFVAGRITTPNNEGYYADGSSTYNSIQLSTVTGDGNDGNSTTSGIIDFAGAYNRLEDSYIEAQYRPVLLSGSYNTIDRSTMVTTLGGGWSALDILGSSNTVSDSYLARVQAAGGGSGLSFGSTLAKSARFLRTTIVTNNGSAITLNGNEHSFESVYAYSPLGDAVFMYNGAHHITFTSCTLHSANSYALFTYSTSSGTIQDSTIRSDSGHALGFGTAGTQTGAYVVARSTVLAASNRTAIQVAHASHVTIHNSYLQGLNALTVRGSSVVVVADSRLAATNDGAGFYGSRDLTVSSAVITAGSSGRGVYVSSGGLPGQLDLSSVTITAALWGVSLGTQTAPFTLDIDSVNFRSLASGATAIHFLGGTFVATITAAAFEDSSIGANVSAAALDGASRLTMRGQSGDRKGTAYENDPQGLVWWEGEVTPYPGCAVTNEVGAGKLYATIQAAVNALPATLTGRSCVVVRDAATYNEQVTVQGFVNNGSSITIFTDPSVGSYAVVDPPAGSTAAFHILNASVTVSGLSAVIDQQIPYGVLASSGFVTLSSVSVSTNGGAGVYAAGVEISSWSRIEYSTVAVWNADGVVLRASPGWSTILASTFTTMNAAYRALYANGTTSNTVTGSYFQNLAGEALRLENAHDNAVTGAVAVSSQSGTYALVIWASDRNSIQDSLASNPLGWGAYFVTGSDYNSVTRTTFTSNSPGHSAIYIGGGSSNTITHSYARNAAGTAITLQSGASRYRIEESTVSAGGAGNAILFNGAIDHELTASRVESAGAHAVVMQSGAHHIRVDRSTIANTGSSGALYVSASDSITVTGSFLTSAQSNAIYMDNGADYNEISFSTMITGGPPGNHALRWSFSSWNRLSDSYAQALLGRSVYIANTSDDNEVTRSTIVADNSSDEAVYIYLSNRTRIADSSLRNPSGSALYIQSSGANSVVRSTVASASASRYGITIVTASSNTFTESYVAGSTAVFVDRSTGTDFRASTLVASGTRGAALATAGGGVNLWVTSTTLQSAATGTGLRLSPGLSGTVTVSSVTAKGGAWGVSLATQPSNFTLTIDSVNFRGLAAGATAIHFLGGTFVATITAAGFEDSALGANVSAASLNGASRLTMRGSKGVRHGPAYENDPASLVDWPDLAAPLAPALWFVGLSSGGLTYGTVGAEGYTVQASTAADFTGVLHSSTAFNGEDRLAPTTLDPNTTYYFRAGALWGASTVYAQPTVSSPTLANLVSATTTYQIFVTSIVINWAALPLAPPDASSKTSEGYVLEVADDVAFSNIVASSYTPNPALSTLTVNGLYGDATYYFRVGSLNWSGAAHYAVHHATYLPPILGVDLTTVSIVVPGGTAMNTELVVTTATVVTNTGNVNEIYHLRVTTVSAGSPWFVGASPHSDRYSAWAVINSTQPAAGDFDATDQLADGENDCSGAFSMGNQDCEQVPPGETRTLWMKIWTPLVTTTANSQDIRLIVRPEYAR